MSRGSGRGGRIDVVLVCGGRWHDFDHARLELLRRLAADDRVRTRVFEDYRAVGEAHGADGAHRALAQAQLLVTYTCDVRPDAAQQRALVDFVAGGGRWLALHGTNSAIDPPPPGGPKRYSTPRVLGAVAEVLGSQFLGHPPIEPYTVEVTEPDHPLVAGIGSFEVTDELYVCERRGPLEVLLHTRFSGESPGFVEGDAPADQERQPVLYLRRHGEGEVCYLTLGHCRGRFDVQDLGIDDLGRVDRGSWDVPEFQQVLDRCLAWGLGTAASAATAATAAIEGER